VNADEFVEANREEVDERIKAGVGIVKAWMFCDCEKSGTDHRHEREVNLNDLDRVMHVLHNPDVSEWAVSKGCKLERRPNV